MPAITAPKIQNKPIHATENLVPYAPRVPHPATTHPTTNQPAAKKNQTGHPSKQHRNRNTTRPDQQPKAMRIQSRRHPTCFTQSWKSSRNDIRRESRSRGNRIASASFGRAQAHAIPLPGPAGRVPQASPHRSPALRAVFRRRVRTAPRPCGPCSAGEPGSLGHGSGSASGGLRPRSAFAVPSVIFAGGRLAAHVYLSSPAGPRPLAGWTRSRVRCGQPSQARAARPSSPVCACGGRPVRRRVGRDSGGLLQPAPGTSPHAPPLGSDRPRLMLRPAAPDRLGVPRLAT